MRASPLTPAAAPSSSIWRACRSTPRQRPRPSSPRSRRGWPRSARRFPSWSTTTTSTWRPTSPTHTRPQSAALRNVTTTASPATPPAHSCASNSAAISTRADWPHTYTKAARKHLTGCRAPTTDLTRRDEEQDMSVYRVTEVIGVSDESWEAAARNAVETAAGTVRELRIAEVVRQDVTIENGRITAYRVRLALSFKYESTGN